MKYKHIFLTLLRSVLLLCFGYVLTRYVLFDLHGMIQWPMTMLTLGVIVVCMFFRSELVSLVAAAGYTVSFLIGVLFQIDYMGPGGTSYRPGFHPSQTCKTDIIPSCQKSQLGIHLYV